jgi:hypothetical protein
MRQSADRDPHLFRRALGDKNADKNAAIRHFRKPSSLSRFMKLGIITETVITRAQSGSEPMSYP